MAIRRQQQDLSIALPPTRDCICMGSSHGWPVTLSGAFMLDVHLLNPPPSLITLSSYRRRRSFNGCLSAVKAILSVPPSADNDGFTVIIVHEPLSRLAFVRAGDTSWTVSPEPQACNADVMHCKGKLFSVDRLGFVYVWDGCLTRCVKVLDHFNESTYLVESLTGKSSMVHRKKKKKDEYRTVDSIRVNFVIFELDLI